VNVGTLNRRVRIETYTTSVDSYGEPIKTWIALDHVWADIQPLRNSEQFAAQQVNRLVSLRMTVHYRTDVTEQMRILYDGDYYDIQGIRELGYREGLELLCGLWKPEGG